MLLILLNKKALNHDYKNKTKSTPKISKGKNIKRKKMRGNKKEEEKKTKKIISNNKNLIKQEKKMQKT